MRGSKDIEKTDCGKKSQKIWFHGWMINNEEMEFTRRKSQETIMEPTQSSRHYMTDIHNATDEGTYRGV
jgi:hypothetical protein